MPTKTESFLNLSHTKYILHKMCEAVGADFNQIDFQKEHWFWQYSWTAEQQNQFKNWFITYLKSDQEARKELMRIPSKDKRDLEKVWNEFNLNWGWKNEN